MDKQYLKLFTEICRAMTVLSETVMDYNKEKNDDKGFETAQTMRDDYQKLYDTISEENFDIQKLTRADFARFLVGAIVLVKNLENDIEKKQTAIKGYKTITIPKLERVVNETKTDEEALKIANEIFQIIDEVK